MNATLADEEKIEEALLKEAIIYTVEGKLSAQTRKENNDHR